MSFIEQRFPITISYGSRGGPGYQTRAIASASGHEDRNSNWTQARHSYDAGTGVKLLEELESLIEFFHVVKGSFMGFRWKDWLDYKSCVLADTVAYDDQVLGTGDGAEDEFQLIKTYTVGSTDRVRTITKPVSGTVKVGVLGSERLQGDATYPWTIDTATGIITFTSTVPPSGDVTAGYEFDVPCRFDTDVLSNAIEDYDAGAAQVPIIEIRDSE